MKCTKCNDDLPEGAIYCPFCFDYTALRSPERYWLCPGGRGTRQRLLTNMTVKEEMRLTPGASYAVAADGRVAFVVAGCVRVFDNKGTFASNPANAIEWQIANDDIPRVPVMLPPWLYLIPVGFDKVPIVRTNFLYSQLPETRPKWHRLFSGAAIAPTTYPAVDLFSRTICWCGSKSGIQVLKESHHQSGEPVYRWILKGIPGFRSPAVDTQGRVWSTRFLEEQDEAELYVGENRLHRHTDCAGISSPRLATQDPKRFFAEYWVHRRVLLERNRTYDDGVSQPMEAPSEASRSDLLKWWPDDSAEPPLSALFCNDLGNRTIRLIVP